MRSTLLVVASCLVLLTAFLVYSSFQSGKILHGVSATGGDPPAPVLKKRDSWNKISPGENAWFKTYDEKGDLKNRFRADDYLPRADGRIDVTNPIAEFFMPNNRMMRLIGKKGQVVMPEATHTSASSSDDFAGGSPERGEINDVTIQLFNLFPDSNVNVPDETIRTNNVNFDNATRLITTEAYPDPSGEMIERDQVPVHMRSDNDRRGYDFDGKGLTLRWNDADGRMDLLQIAHGEDLIVKDTSSASGTFGGEGKGPKTSANTPAVPIVSPAALDPAPSKGNSTAQPAAQQASTQLPGKPGSNPATARTSPPAVPIPYVATFYENVRITQGDDVLITANRMDLDFVSRQKQESAATSAPSAPTTAETVKSGTHASPEAGPPVDGNSIATSQPAATQPVATGMPTTRPTSPPVVVRWTGKMVMLSAQANRPKVAAGDAIVDLTGDPVTVRRTPAGQQEGDDVRAARLIYHTADGSAKLVNSQTVPQVVISKLINKKIDPNSTVTTSTLDYKTDPAGRKFALLTGPGHATMPMQAGAEKSADPKASVQEMMDTHWEKEAKVFFIGKGQDEQTIDHVDLAGEVDVKHPQLTMHSQALSLFFAPPAPTTRPVVLASASTTQPAKPEKPQQELKRVFASQDVHCVMAGQNGKRQTIDCDDLEMLTARSADGKFYARRVNAHGSVHASDPDQDLRANVVELTLKPAVAKPTTAALAIAKPQAAEHVEIPPTEVSQTQPAREDSDTASAELEKLDARENVTVKNREGSVATGSRLIVTTEDNQNHVRLIGSPMATVIDAKQNTIIGPLITVEQGVAHVVGAGNMHVLQEQSGGVKPRPMDVAWIDRADMNGKGNRVDLLGGVSVTTYDADGTINVANGDRVHIDLVDKPLSATRPSTQPTTRPLNKPAAPDSMQMDVMKDKDAQCITIDGKAQVVSTLRASDGTVARQFALYGPKIIYQLLDSKELSAKTLLVPSAGRMYVGDHRPPEKAKPDAAANPEDDQSGGRGDTAFQWSKQLIYGELQRQAIITGDVLVVHQPLGKQADEDRVRINADRMTALFDQQKRVEKIATTQPVKVDATQPATQPARGGEPGESLQLKHLTADGHVVITRSTGSVLYAERVDFEPLTHWMFAHGTQNNPARYIDADPHKQPMIARDMQWNTQTWNVKMNDTKAVNPK